MITLKQLRTSIDEYLIENPDAKDYPVITFDYFNGEANPVELVKGYNFLGEDMCKDNFIFDTFQEISELDESLSMSFKKVILL